ncbi:citrate synthase family protein [Leeia aquatica]|uniref:citrate synthase (unknown stereospecificity) n=1 Tax=Leeia aquatica TaxID=2725557 RepID=A0A847RZ45_9NEIS|nr:citrate synthase family protein [Leeia aquatica]NLR76400.1 helix-turn-helix domain-containing protein [Leeia aquatica]
MNQPDLPDTDWLDAKTAAAWLGVSRATLYAYVSRGWLHPREQGRHHRYAVKELVRLRARQQARSGRAAAARSLDWGQPVLQSALTLVQAGELYYRGRAVTLLAQQATLEDVARLLWQVPGEDWAQCRAPAALQGLDVWAALARCVGQFSLLPVSAMGLVRTVAQALLGQGDPGLALHHWCAEAWERPESAEAIRLALVLCADHELNPSSFTARCIAATGADLAAVLLGAMAALSGARHGGATREVATWWAQLPTETVARRVALQAAAGQASVGWGHPLYPQGDPRARLMLATLPMSDAGVQLVQEMQAAGAAPPSLDFGLVALARHWQWPQDAAFTLFALGRSVGWLAHALEQVAQGQPIRPRADYTGPLPDREPAPPGRRVRLLD